MRVPTERLGRSPSDVESAGRGGRRLGPESEPSRPSTAASSVKPDFIVERSAEHQRCLILRLFAHALGGTLMIAQKSPRPPRIRKEWLRRLDRVAADLNVLLVMFAFGLATLDLTFLATQRLLDRLPQMTRVVYTDAPSIRHSVADPPELP